MSGNHESNVVGIKIKMNSWMSGAFVLKTCEGAVSPSSWPVSSSSTQMVPVPDGPSSYVQRDEEGKLTGSEINKHVSHAYRVPTMCCVLYTLHSFNAQDSPMR